MFELTQIKGIGNSTLKKLKKANIKTLVDLANSTIESLTQIEGVGIKSATKWINTAKTKLSITASKTESVSKIKPRPSVITKESKISIDQSLLREIRNDLNQIFNRLEIIESRLSKIEKKEQYIPREHIQLKKGIKIKNINLFSNIVKEAIEEINTGRFGINKISLKELFNSINKNYYITKEIFTKYLLDLQSRNKIQLEPGLVDQDFYIEDNYGNIYKIIRILE